jgi:hypothetical protein
MPECARRVDNFTVTGRADTPELAAIRALRHLIKTGKQGCDGGCAQGECAFALTELAEESGVTQDGDTWLYSMTGSGICFCQLA